MERLTVQSFQQEGTCLLILWLRLLERGLVQLVLELGLLLKDVRIDLLASIGMALRLFDKLWWQFYRFVFLQRRLRLVTNITLLTLLDFYWSNKLWHVHFVPLVHILCFLNFSWLELRRWKSPKNVLRKGNFEVFSRTMWEGDLKCHRNCRFRGWPIFNWL